MVSQRTVKLLQPSIANKVTIPAVLTIAGSDNSGGAGIEADLKTFTSHDVYGMTCITALTAQNTQLVESFERTPEFHLRKILDRNFDDFVYGYPDFEKAPLKVIKTGMLTQEAVTVLLDYLPMLEKHRIKLVVDPVMVSTSGSDLFDADAMQVCTDKIIKQAYLVTPNFIEATSLLKIKLGEDNYSEPRIESIDDFSKFVINLQQQLGCENILVKGGHIPWDKRTQKPFTGNFEVDKDHIQLIDVLYQSKTDSVVIYESEFIFTKDTHGTGCTLSSSIAANIAKGLTLEQSLPLSINYIHKAIISLQSPLGHGHGPLNHTVSPEKGQLKVVAPDSNQVGKHIIREHGTSLQYFKQHPIISSNWKKYTQHQFIYDIAQNKLPFPRFLYFLKQDFYYLVNYAQVHGLAASVAPNYLQIHSESFIIESVIKEISKHKEKLQKKFDIDYDNADLDVELQPGKACLDYCNYLLEIGRREDFLGIKVALAPCLHGYYEAAVLATKVKNQEDAKLGVLESDGEAKVYEEWIKDYDSDWYLAAYNDGIKALDELFEDTEISSERLEELVDIFNKVTILEVNFWSEVTTGY